MILSVCPNPSVDCTIELDVLKLGSLNRIENKVITYSGKALNVAIGVARLGGDSFATGFMFEDNGKMFVHALDDERVKNTFVWSNGSARTNYKIVDKRSMMTEINDKGEAVSHEKQAELLSLVSELSKSASITVISGSLPKGVSADYYAKLSKAVNPNAKRIIDTTGDNMLEALKMGAYLVKPNLDELQGVTGESYTTFDEMIEGCRKLISAGVTGAQYVQYGYDARTEILGTKGIVKVGTQRADSVETVTRDMTIVSDSMDSWRTLFREAYVAEAQAFADSILNDTEPQVTGYDGKIALTMVNAGLRSYLEKRPVDI